MSWPGALSRLVLLAIYAFGIARLAVKERWSELIVCGGVLVLLAAFFGVAAIARRSAVGREIRLRTQTWSWMIGVLLLAMSLHAAVIFVLLALLSVVALREYFSLLALHQPGGFLRSEDRAAILLAYSTVPATYALAWSGWYGLYVILIPVYVTLALPMLLVAADNPRGILVAMGAMFSGLFLFVFLFSHAALLAHLSPFLLMYALVETEDREELTYCVGKLLAPLPAPWLHASVVPHVNPRKTWAASAAASLGCAGLSAALAPLMPELPAGRPPPEFLFWLGLLAGWLGLAGDLATGAIKRDLEVKDTGQSLPGHGGVIDRINGVIFTVPVIFHVLWYFYFPGQLRLR